jgi:alkaline phosphatase
VFRQGDWETLLSADLGALYQTPASFIAHVPSRAQESAIAEQILGLNGNGSRTDRPLPLDLAIGGGGCYFLPKGHPFSCRGDDLDLVSKAEEEGWNTQVLFGTNNEDVSLQATGQQQQHQSNSSSRFAAASHPLLSNSLDLPLLALLAPSNTPYEIDRRANQPSLSSLALKALDTLDKSPLNDKGFLIMIEGSQIDLCAHQNDPASHAREIEAYQEAIEKVTEWVNKKNVEGEETILISTSDHETGGLTLGKQLSSSYPNYAYYPESLIGVKESAASLSAHLLAFARTAPLPSIEAVKQFVREETLIKGAAFTAENRGLPQDGDIDRLLSCLRTTPGTAFDDPPINTADDCRNIIADLISQRAEVGWSTSGHTGVDVPVHALGTDRLKGNMENTDVSELEC